VSPGMFLLFPIFRLLQGSKQRFQAVGLYLEGGCHLLAQFAGRESPPLKPDQVGFGQIDKETSFVLAERHSRQSQLSQRILHNFADAEMTIALAIGVLQPYLSVSRSWSSSATTLPTS
jgi:hypothetical protein